MRFLYPALPAALVLLALSACDSTTGGAMPIDAKKLLDGLDGPKIPTLADSQTESAQNAEKKGDYAQAVQVYQQMMERDENNSEIALALADALRKNSEYDKAIAGYNFMIKKDPKNLAAKEGKGLALISKGDFENSTPIFDEVIKADGTRWKSLNAMGILFVTRNLYHDAQKYFEEALKQSPDNIVVLNNLGLVQALNKQFGDAVKSLTQASEKSDPESMNRKRVDLNLALTYGTMGKLDEAERLAKIYLSGAQLSNNLGLYAHLAKDDQMAKSYLNMALTESKTYYSKAWDNLEAVSGANGNTTSSTKDDKQTTNNKEKAPVKDAKKASKKPIIAAQPIVAPAPVLEKKEEPKVETPKDDAQKTDKPKNESEGGLMDLLGSLKADDTTVAKPEEDAPKPATTTIIAPTETKAAPEKAPETKVIPTDKPIAPTAAPKIESKKVETGSMQLLGTIKSDDISAKPDTTSIVPTVDTTKAKPASGTIGVLGTIPAADVK